MAFGLKFNVVKRLPVSSFQRTVPPVQPVLERLIDVPADIDVAEAEPVSVQAGNPFTVTELSQGLEFAP